MFTTFYMAHMIDRAHTRHLLSGQKHYTIGQLPLYIKVDPPRHSMHGLGGLRHIAFPEDGGGLASPRSDRSDREHIPATPQRSTVSGLSSGSFTPPNTDQRSGTEGRVASEHDFDPSSPSLKRSWAQTSYSESFLTPPPEKSRRIIDPLRELEEDISSLDHDNSETPISKRTLKPMRRRKPHPKLPWTLFPRRSPRLAKPLTEFTRYPDLPAEIKFMIWNSAQVPRLVYIRNRAVAEFLAKVQTPQPKWFRSDMYSHDVAVKNYVNMFSLHGYPTGFVDCRSLQSVNPDIDVIALEPCCSGCRGVYCVRSQFSAHDKSLIKILAVQNESSQLHPSSRPCWESLSETFPNIETLYLLKSSLKGDVTEEQALILVEADERELKLQDRFAEWKKGAGKDRPITRLQFAVTTKREPCTNKSDKRYRCIEGRLTGLAGDIIVG